MLFYEFDRSLVLFGIELASMQEKIMLSITLLYINPTRWILCLVLESGVKCHYPDESNSGRIKSRNSR